MSEEEMVSVEHDQELVFSIEHYGIWYDIEMGTLELKMGHEENYSSIPEIIFEAKTVTGRQISGALSDVTGLKSLTITDPESDPIEP